MKLYPLHPSLCRPWVNLGKLHDSEQLNLWGLVKNPRNFPQIFTYPLSPTCPQNLWNSCPQPWPRILGTNGDNPHLSPKFSLWNCPQKSPKCKAKSVPVPTPSPKFKDGDGDPRASRPHLQTLSPRPGDQHWPKISWPSNYQPDLATLKFEISLQFGLFKEKIT